MQIYLSEKLFRLSVEFFCDSLILTIESIIFFSFVFTSSSASTIHRIPFIAFGFLIK